MCTGMGAAVHVRTVICHFKDIGVYSVCVASGREVMNCNTDMIYM